MSPFHIVVEIVSGTIAIAAFTEGSTKTDFFIGVGALAVALTTIAAVILP